MSTDPFTEAARAEAERRWPRGQADGHGLPGHARMSRRIGFEIGALWAVAQEPTDAEKDAAMDALGCELRVVENGQSTCELHGGYATSDDVCEVVEVALSAARAARRDEETR